MNIPYCLPDDITPEQFLAEYWQKKPLLIRQGLPQLLGMFEPDDILGLALDPEATARLITQTPRPEIADPKIESDFNWKVKNSPLNEEDFANLPEKWTTLVQNIEQWSPEVGNLWRAFDFIPQWQRDDIMVSFAPASGSVGKHYDEYDVFLAQGYGERRWKLGKFCDDNTEFVADQPIRIFDDMGEVIFDEVLQTGDVLYVPPKLSHSGIAMSDAMTFSFGFRRPNLMQVLDNLTDVATTESRLFKPMTLQQNMQSSGKITTDSIEAIKANLIQMIESPLGSQLIQQAVCETVSKRQYDILTPEEVLSFEEVQEYLNDGASIQIDYSSRLIYQLVPETADITIFANGQKIADLSQENSLLLAKLSDGEALQASDLKNIDEDTLMEWLENGWVMVC